MNIKLSKRLNEELLKKGVKKLDITTLEEVAKEVTDDRLLNELEEIYNIIDSKRVIRKCTTENCQEWFMVTKLNHSSKCLECVNDLYVATKKGYWLYMFMNGDEPVYIGQTTNLRRRMSSHLGGHTVTKEMIKSNDWTSLYALDLSKCEINIDDLLEMEGYLINHYKPKYNNHISSMSGINLLDIEERLMKYEDNWVEIKENDTIK